MSEAKSINELNADLFHAEEVDRFSDPKEARKKAMDYLARREYGRDELVKKLGHCGLQSTTSRPTEVDRLTDDGLQSDERFAGSFVQSRINQGKGPVRIRQELKERGSACIVAENALEEADQDWFELARDVRVQEVRRGSAGGFLRESTADAVPAIPRIRI